MSARNKTAHLHLVERTFSKARHNKRPPAPVEEMGLAPTHLPVPARAVSHEVRKAAPWLRKADAHLVELFCRLVAGERADYDTMPTTMVHGSAGWTHWPPSPIRVHAMRTDSGRPSSSMRFRAWTAMVTSVA